METEKLVKLLNAMTAKLMNNRGLAERALRIFESNHLADYIAEHREDCEDAQSSGTLRDYFTDILYFDWDGDHRIHYFMDILLGLNEDDCRVSGYNYLADLMVMYYESL